MDVGVSSTNKGDCVCMFVTYKLETLTRSKIARPEYDTWVNYFTNAVFHQQFHRLVVDIYCLIIASQCAL